MRGLVKLQRYSRKEVHDILNPAAPFSDRSGTWGLQEIVKVFNDQKDYVFFVTDAKRKGNNYNDIIHYDGTIKWDTQNRMDLHNQDVQNFINHDPVLNNVYLFWRRKSGEDYVYFGLLQYVDHDKTSSAPVHFYWHIIDFDADDALKNVDGLVLYDRMTGKIITKDDKSGSTGKLTLVAPPKKRKKSSRSGVSASDFEKGNIDFQGEQAKNTVSGKAGEDLVVEYEKKRLISEGRSDLADKVIATRNTLGNAAKFDVQSYNKDGSDRYIEVKTTTGSKNNDFRISEREVAFSEAHSDSYYLYRVFDFDGFTKNGKLYIVEGAIDRSKLSATNYVANI